MRSSSPVLLGVGGEAVGGERVGDRVQRGAERALAVGRAGHRRGHRAAVLDADLLGHRLGLVGRQQRERPAEQRDEQVVVPDGERRAIDLGRRRLGSASTAGRRPPCSPRSTTTSR